MAGVDDWHVYAGAREAFADGTVTSAIYSFLRYNTPRGPAPP